MTLEITGVILKEVYAVASFLWYLTQKHYFSLSVILRSWLKKLVSCSYIYQVVTWTEKNPAKGMRQIIQNLIQTTIASKDLFI